MIIKRAGLWAVATGLKRSVFILIPKKGNAKEHSNYHTVALISHASKVMLKILQTRLQQYVNTTPEHESKNKAQKYSLRRALKETSVEPHIDNGDFPHVTSEKY